MANRPPKLNLERLTISVSKNLMDEVRVIMDTYGLTKTTAVVMALKQFVDAQSAMRFTQKLQEIELQTIERNSKDD